MKKAKQIIKDFEEQLISLQQEEYTLVAMAVKGIHSSYHSLVQLKKWLAEHEFDLLTEEINFFKNMQSIPLSYFLYFTELRTCELQKPKAGLQFQVAYLEKELKKINKFFYQYSEFANYMELGETYLDPQFFSISQGSEGTLKSLIEETPSLEFESNYRLLWAKIKAKHKLIDHIKATLIQLKQPHQKLPLKKVSNLKWTASKTAMTELVYALYSARALNSGEAELKEIASALQYIFQTDVGDLYRTYTEIRARKLQPTKFLDHLKVNLEQKMYEAEE
ncbi:RteC domain-containing protein [Mesonia aestuariivivens]|uniref:RteC domain-containing protein n=1 Tax=Mesonia aestuariivivens TaxID=2796128 RepID=A0ABS6W4Y2_9FLAO|nr:RteC domain-containing protein [Mesonia aestuariivivens]MBW2962922.1 RteC domain-containing protein [Mesonia aestuariivivens]